MSKELGPSIDVKSMTFAPSPDGQGVRVEVDVKCSGVEESIVFKLIDSNPPELVISDRSVCQRDVVGAVHAIHGRVVEVLFRAVSSELLLRADDIDRKSLRFSLHPSGTTISVQLYSVPHHDFHEFQGAQLAVGINQTHTKFSAQFSGNSTLRQLNHWLQRNVRTVDIIPGFVSLNVWRIKAFFTENSRIHFDVDVEYCPIASVYFCHQWRFVLQLETSVNSGIDFHFTDFHAYSQSNRPSFVIVSALLLNALKVPWMRDKLLTSSWLHRVVTWDAIQGVLRNVFADAPIVPLSDPRHFHLSNAQGRITIQGVCSRRHGVAYQP